MKGTTYEEICAPKTEASSASSSTAALKGAPKTKAKATPKPKAGYFICPVLNCRKHCKRKLGLSKNTQMFHTEGTKAADGFTCDLCPYFTKNQKALTEHKRNPINHTAQAKLCPHCGAHFPGTNVRNKHAAQSCYKKNES